MSHFVYMARCADGSLYTGTARDVDARMAAHNAGRGAKYTKSRLPVTAVYREKLPNRGAALSREAAIKGLTRGEKLALAAAYRAQVPRCLEKTALTLADFIRMEEMEAACYDPAYITPAAEAFAWYEKNPDSTIAFADAEGSIQGFVNLFPLSDAVAARLRAGCFSDHDLTAADVRTPVPGLSADMFLSCILVSPACRGSGLPLMLLAAAVERCAPMEDTARGIYLDAATPGGAGLARRLGLRDQGPTDHGTRLFSCRYRTFARKVRLLAPREP